ncbi:copper chaperone PCu(A)C [Kytococcus sp. Marseille-QA3725]
MSSTAPRALVAALLALSLAGCSGSAEGGDTEPGAGKSSTDAATSGSPEGESGQESEGAGESDITLTDGWVKATDDKMTGLFGTLENHSDKTITLVTGSSDAAGTVELHEVASENGKDQMRPVEGGMTVRAGGRVDLEPGGLHVMLMDLPEKIVAGDTIEITLEDADGKTYDLTAESRSFEGGDEDYGGGHDHQH